MKRSANSSCAYQITDRSQNAVIKYLKDEKTHGVINNKVFKRFSWKNNQLHAVKLFELQIEHKEPIIVGFFIL